MRAGSVLPLGTPIESTQQKQGIASVRVYPGADGDIAVYQDDGTTYAYEHGCGELTHLHWDDAAQQLTHTGAPAWTAEGQKIVQIVHGTGSPA